MATDFTIIKITPLSAQSPAQAKRHAYSAPISIETFRASQILRPSEDLHNYIRRTAGTRFLTERIFSTEHCGSFWQICQSYAPETTKKDKRQWIVLQTGRLYTVTIGTNWFVPQSHDGSPRLLTADELDEVCKDLCENIAQSLSYVRKVKNRDIDSKVFFPQESYTSINKDAFAAPKPLANLDTLSSRLFEISQLIAKASKMRPCANNLMLLLAAFYESNASATLNHLRLCADVEKIQKKYSKQEAAEMFFTVMDAMLSVVVAYARVVVEISRLDTSRFAKEAAGQLVDSENWLIMAHHAIANGDVKARIVANQFLKDVENADYVCASINKIAEVSAFYKGLNDVIADIDDADENGNGNDELILAPLDDKAALGKLVAKARRKMQNAAMIEKNIAKVFRDREGGWSG